jgi:hypothetical protein
MIPEGSLLRSTARALVEPRRMVPILVVSGALVIAQAAYSQDPLAVPLAIAMAAAFVAIGPVSWRILFPDGLEFSHGAARLLLYATLGTGLVAGIGVALPQLLRMGPTFLTEPVSLIVCVALFLVGGWGLGRDIGLEVRLRREIARAEGLRREAERSQLLSLRSNLDPHFLFNTLNAIAEWCRQDGAVAERAVLDLSAMLRSVLDGVRAPSWPLAKELELVRNLFALHLLRDPSLFEATERLDPAALEVEVPPMAVLSLAENAVKHGPAAGHRGTIRLEVAQLGERVEISLRNPGPYRGPREGSDGLPTLRKRLEVAYGGEATLTLSTEEQTTLARLTLPVRWPNPGVLA